MGRCHHYSCGSALEAYAVAEFRGRTDVVEKVDVQAVCAEHVSGYLCELAAVIATVVGDADLKVVSLDILENVVCKPLGGHSDSVLVHPVGADTHDAAETAGTELEIAVERILEICLRAFHKGFHFIPCLLVEFFAEPALSCSFVVSHMY